MKDKIVFLKKTRIVALKSHSCHFLKLGSPAANSPGLLHSAEVSVPRHHSSQSFTAFIDCLLTVCNQLDSAVGGTIIDWIYIALF